MEFVTEAYCQKFMDVYLLNRHIVQWCAYVTKVIFILVSTRKFPLAF